MFILIFLLSVIILIIGLIRPSLFSRIFRSSSRKRVGTILGLITLVLFIIAVMTSPSPTPPEPTVDQSVTQTVFDIPSLVGKNVDEAKAILGTPNYDPEPNQIQKDAGIHEWKKAYKKDGFELFIIFNSETRQVIEFFLADTQSEESLLVAGNLRKDDPRYNVKFDYDNTSRPRILLGVTATPRQ